MMYDVTSLLQKYDGELLNVKVVLELGNKFSKPKSSGEVRYREFLYK